MDHKVIQKEQEGILAQIYQSPKRESELHLIGVLPALRQIDNINPTLWGLLNKLWIFAHAIDVEHPHPDLFTLFHGSLAKECEFNRFLCDIVKFATLSPDHGWHPEIVRALDRVLNEYPGIKEVLQFVEDSSRTLLNVRFVTQRDRRDSIRSHKQQQRFTLSSFLRLNCWSNIPGDFRHLYRGTNRFLLDIEKAQTRYDYFRSLGLTAMAKEIYSSINEMKTESDTSQYYGFNRTTVQMAAAILAKMCGYEYSPDARDVFAFPDVFPGYQFFDSRVDSRIECRPTASPLHILGMSEEIKRLVDHLEAFPEAHGKPLFDHYWVIVPSLQYPIGAFGFRDVDGSQLSFGSWERANLEFEKTLFKHHYIVGVLLGERNGEYYFVSYWL